MSEETLRAAFDQGPAAAAAALRQSALLGGAGAGSGPADLASVAATWVDMDSDGDGAGFLATTFAGGVRSLCARVRRSCGEEMDADLLAWAEGTPDAEVVAALTECARAVRNLCVDPRAQKVLFDKLAQDLLQALRALPRLHDSSPFGPWREAVLVLGRVLVQALANLCVGAPDHASKLWPSDASNTFIDQIVNVFRLAIVHTDLGLLRNLVGLLYGLVLADREKRAPHLVANETVSVLLLHSAVLAMTAIGDHTHTEADAQASNDPGQTQAPAEESAAAMPSDPVAADLHANLVWLFGELINAGQGESLFQRVRDAEQTEKLVPVLTSLWLGHRLEEENVAEDERAQADAAGMELSFDALAEFYAERVQARQPALERSRAEQLALRALGSYAQDDRVFARSPTKRQLLHTVLGELETAAINKELVDFGVRVDLLRVVANSCFRRPSNQDAVREFENGLFIVLNQCNVDERSPFLREWGIVAIRNLCEGNEENQRVIAELRVQGTVQTSVLDKAGLRVELDESGKPKVVPNKVS
ncbi:Ataxin-10-like [Hondaea fermentalgiana]|uniref:Ataxin-10-like n=1 Tax=Hondaea fermentalgiana TaxID=2315210 RepID=A0A2R5GMC6_9STRA|nr:Ataxin-10-like [Hondaea fermentalgiana]|eukprot:GBG29024.1 Ataxin-10-like [Hondaea fermentalgiana]